MLCANLGKHNRQHGFDRVLEQLSQQHTIIYHQKIFHDGKPPDEDGAAGVSPSKLATD